MTSRIPIALVAAVLALAFAGPASAECAGHQQTVKLPTVTAEGGSIPATPAPQTPIPSSGG